MADAQFYKMLDKLNKISILAKIEESAEPQFMCPYCGKEHCSPNGTGTDISCCGEYGHCEPCDSTDTRGNDEIVNNLPTDEAVKKPHYGDERNPDNVNGGLRDGGDDDIGDLDELDAIAAANALRHPARKPARKSGKVTDESVANRKVDTFDMVVDGLDADVAEFMTNGGMSEQLEDRAYEYYCNNGEMPYEVAKDDYMQWLDEKLRDDLADAGYGGSGSALDDGHPPVEESATSGYQVNGKEVDTSSLEVDGINHRDAPDYCDAYISYGCFTDGTELSDNELEQFQNDHPEVAQELASGNAIEAGEAAYDRQKYGESMNEGKDLTALRAKKKEIDDKIDAIVKDGGKVSLTDPLTAQLRKVVADIKAAKKAKNESTELQNIRQLSGLYKPVDFVAEDTTVVAVVEEDDKADKEWANSPDEQYLDTETMTITFSGGLNGPKAQINPNNPGDNPMAMGSLKMNLERASLNLKETTEKIEQDLRAKFVAEAKKDKADPKCPACKKPVSAHKGLQCPDKKEKKDTKKKLPKDRSGKELKWTLPKGKG